MPYLAASPERGMISPWMPSGKSMRTPVPTLAIWPGAMVKLSVECRS